MMRSNPAKDLLVQYRQRRRRDQAARHAAGAAAHYVAAMARAHDTEGPVLANLAGSVDELAGAVEAFEAAQARCARHYTLRAGRLIVTATRQYGGPIVDDATVHGETRDDAADDETLDTFTAHGYTIRPPWAHDTAAGARAVVVAWVGRRPPELYALRRRWEKWRHPSAALVKWPNYSPGMADAGEAPRYGTWEDLAAGMGGLTAGGRDPHEPMNPWPHIATERSADDLLARAVKARQQAARNVRDRP